MPSNIKEFCDKVSDNNHLRIKEDLGDGYYLLRESEALRRQAAQDIRCSEDVIIETLRNSRDAKAKNIYIATSLSKNLRNITIIDDGVGIPRNLHKKVFEPYVTSKLDKVIEDCFGVHGRGMALYSISKRSKIAKINCSNINQGCSLSIQTNTDELNEKTDQSTFPNFSINDNNQIIVRGPKNIIRTCCEFAIENRDKVKLYLGSPSEIVATLYSTNKKNINKIDYIFVDDFDQLNVCKRLILASDCKDLAKTASGLGLNISQRTARRIIDRVNKPIGDLLSTIASIGIKSKNRSKKFSEKTSAEDIFGISKISNISYQKPSVKISKDDKEKLSMALRKEFSNIAKNYYLNENIYPKVIVNKDKIKITFDINQL